MSAAVVSSISWVPQGKSKTEPVRFQMSEKDFEEIQRRLDEDKANLAEAEAKTDDQIDSKMDSEVDENLIKEFDLDNYDEDTNETSFFNNEEDDIEENSEDENLEKDQILKTINESEYHANETEEESYVTLDTGVFEAEELEEMMIAETDNLILAARTEDEISHVQVYVYETSEHNLFMHHDILLPTFPLCVEWINFKIADASSIVAVGSFDPEIELWDLDILDPMYPVKILGSSSKITTLGTGKKKRKVKVANANTHVDSVLSLAWNSSYPSILASGSADSTVKLWDISSESSNAIRNFSCDSKVQSVSWNPKNGAMLLCGGYDKKLKLFDTRNVDSSTIKFSISSDVEVCKFDPFSDLVYVGLESGELLSFDTRNPTVPLHTIHGHDSAVSSLDISKTIQGLVVTGSTDKTCKVWDLRNGLKCLASKNVGVGKVYSVGFSPNEELVVAVAGGEGNVIIWNLEGNSSVRKALRGETAQKSDVNEITAVEDDAESEGEADNMEED